MLDFSEFVATVERRAQLIRSGEAGLSVLLAGGLAYFFLSLAARSFGLAIPRGLAVAGAFLPLLAGAGAYLIVYRRRIDPAPLLLSLDLSLDLPARLSSLQELGDQNPAIRNRIEARTVPYLGRWKRGLPVPRRAVAGLILGISLFTAGLAIALIPSGPAPPPGPSSPAGVSSPSPSAAGETQPKGESGAAAHRAGAEGQTEATEGGYTLADLIAELSVDPSLTEGPAASDRSALRLRELLARIEGRLRTEGGPLTGAERAELERALPTAPPPVGERLAEILSPSPAEQAGGGNGSAPATGRAEGTSLPPAEERSVGIPGMEGSTAIPSASPGSPEEGGLPGSEGTGEAPGSDIPLGTEGGSRLLSAPLSGTVGEEGKFELLLTAGVPIEDRPEEGETGPPAVSFAKIDSILSGRSLPPGAIDAVRRYFQTITEGGP